MTVTWLVGLLPASVWPSLASMVHRDSGCSEEVPLSVTLGNFSFALSNARQEDSGVYGVIIDDTHLILFQMKNRHTHEKWDFRLKLPIILYRVFLCF